ncbi:MAG: hypothetical protein ABFS45_05260 [Pseudomonadota bacterium]
MSGFFVSLFLPWLVGVLWLRRLWPGARLPEVLGYGYLVGVLIVTLLLRLWNLAGLELRFLPIALALSVVAALSFILGTRPAAPTGTTSMPGPGARERTGTAAGTSCLWRWENLVFAFFLGLLAWRFAILVEDNLLRPLFSWDAWMNWAPKTRVWFELGHLAPYVSPQTWLEGASLDGAYTLGNSQAWDYPITVPLILLWTALGLDAWHDDLVKMPWVLCGAALGLGVYGQLRNLGVSRALAIVAVYLLLSIPYLEIHLVLGGYAEIWLATALCFGLLAFLRWRETRNPADLVLALTFAAFCLLIKKPGVIWGTLLALAIVVEVLPRWVLMMIAAGVAAVVALIFVAGGVSFSLPVMGDFRLAADGITLPYLGSQPWHFTDVSAPLVDSLFFSTNWHLSWYAAVALLAAGIFTGRVHRKDVGPLFFLVATLGTFLLIFFFIPRYSREALKLVTLNRAMLQLVPSIFVFMVWWFYAPQQRSVQTER